MQRRVPIIIISLRIIVQSMGAYQNSTQVHVVPINIRSMEYYDLKSHLMAGVHIATLILVKGQDIMQKRIILGHILQLKYIHLR